MVGWVAGSNENITISTQVKDEVEVGVELCKTVVDVCDDDVDTSD